MARRRNPTPSYLPHNKSGRGRAVWTDPAGVRHDRLLPGLYGSPESREAFARLALELTASPAAATPAPPAGLTVAELLLAYLQHADRHYRGPDGKPTGETERLKAACRHVRALYAHTPAAAFGPLALKAVRERFVAAGWCRKSVNQQVERVRRIFKWAAAEELVPAAVHHALAAVPGLQRGRTAAPESDPVTPVEDAVVDAVLPHLNRHVRGLVRFQRLTGCRPGEACRVRPCDIDTTGPVWVYRPGWHKGSWRGKDRVIAIGPKGQALVREYLTADPADHLFSPRRAVEEVRAARAASRRTPRYPSHVRRNALKRKARPQRMPSARYTTRSYFAAVARACRRAGVVHWHPNQLRHSFATAVRRGYGLEAAQVLLGHAKADITQVYAEKNQALAADVAARIG